MTSNKLWPANHENEPHHQGYQPNTFNCQFASNYSEIRSWPMLTQTTLITYSAFSIYKASSAFCPKYRQMPLLSSEWSRNSRKSSGVLLFWRLKSNVRTQQAGTPPVHWWSEQLNMGKQPPNFSAFICFHQSIPNTHSPQKTLKNLNINLSKSKTLADNRIQSQQSCYVLLSRCLAKIAKMVLLDGNRLAMGRSQQAKPSLPKLFKRITWRNAKPHQVAGRGSKMIEADTPKSLVLVRRNS